MSIENLIPALVGGVLLPVFEFLYGEGMQVLYTVLALVFFIMLDWVAGIRAAKKDATYSSKYGIDGVFRTFFMICLPAGGHFLDMIFGLPSVFFGVLAAGLLYHTIKSATANAIRAGWGQWIPENVLNLLTDWVRSEIESKSSWARRRLKKRGDI